MRPVVGRLCWPAALFALARERKWQIAQLSSWCTRGHLGELCDSMWETTALSGAAASRAPSATVKIGGMTSCIAAMKSTAKRFERENRRIESLISVSDALACSIR